MLRAQQAKDPIEPDDIFLLNSGLPFFCYRFRNPAIRPSASSTVALLPA
jgi:hypothetical protein